MICIEYKKNTSINKLVIYIFTSDANIWRNVSDAVVELMKKQAISWQQIPAVGLYLKESYCEI